MQCAHVNNASHVIVSRTWQDPTTVCMQRWLTQLSHFIFLLCMLAVCVHVNQQTAFVGRLWHGNLHIWIGILGFQVIDVHCTLQQNNVHTSIGHTSPLARASKTGTGHWATEQNRDKNVLTVTKWMKVEEKLPLFVCYRQCHLCYSW